MPQPYLWQPNPRVPATVEEQCSQLCRCRQPATEIRVQLFCSSCTMWQKKSLSQEKGYLWLTEYLKILTRFKKEKDKKILWEKKIIYSLRSWKYEQVYHNTAQQFDNHKITGKKPSWLTFAAKKAASNWLQTIYGVYRARTEIIKCYLLSPEKKIF